MKPFDLAKIFDLPTVSDEMVAKFDKVLAHARNVLNSSRQWNDLLRQTIEPDMVEAVNTPESLKEFNEKLNELETRFGLKLNLSEGEYFLPHKIDPETNKTNKKIKLLSHKDARDYLWQLRHRFMYEFVDFDPKRPIILNEYGHEVPLEYIRDMPDHELSDRLSDGGSWRITFDTLDYSRKSLATMIDEAGRAPWLKELLATEGRHEELADWQEWIQYLDARKAYWLHGPADMDDPDKHGHMSGPRLLKDIARIRENYRAGVDMWAEDDETGFWEIFIQNPENAERILQATEDFIRAQMADPQYEFTDERKRLMGYEPDPTRSIEAHTVWRRIQRSRYVISADTPTTRLTVPDEMLDRPLQHYDIAPEFAMVEVPEDCNLAQDIAAGNNIIFEGNESHRKFYAAKAIILPPGHRFYDSRNDLYYREIIENAENMHINSAAPLGKDRRKLVPILFEGLVPVPEPEPIDGHVQTIKLDRQIDKLGREVDFKAIVSPVLGRRESRLTGLVLRHYNQTPEPGPARFQLTASRKTEPGWEVPTEITKVRTLTLDETLKIIERSQKLDRLRTAFKLNSIDMLRTADGIDDAQLKAKGFKGGREALDKALAEEIWTHEFAKHYSYQGGLDQMKGVLSQPFANQQVNLSDPDNLVHLVDLNPDDKPRMVWFDPTARPRLRVDAQERPAAAVPAAKPGGLKFW